MIISNTILKPICSTPTAHSPLSIAPRRPRSLHGATRSILRLAVCSAAVGLCSVPVARAQCDCDCGSDNRVCGRVVYSNVDTSPELAADGITSSCCIPTGGAGCNNAACECVVTAVDATCANEWTQGCVDLARQLCGAADCDGNGTPEDSLYCIWNYSSIFVQGLAEGQPVPYVTVELESDLGVQFGEGTTDADGNFCICTGATPRTVRVKAKNDAVKVKESKITPLITDSAISAKFEDYIDENDYDDGCVELGDIGIDDSQHTFANAFGVFPVSRALYVCRAVRESREHIASLPDVNGSLITDVTVRLGYYATAWYQAYLAPEGPTIHLPGAQAAVVWHEYGHHLENKLGAFGIIPSFFVQFHDHAFCEEQTLPGGDLPDFCWSFLEGLASWYGAVNSNALFGDPPDFDGNGEPDWTTTGALYSLGDNWVVETPYCAGGYTCPDAVEAVTASVLWDLIDAHVDPDNGSGIREVAQIDVSDVLEVLQATVPLHTCYEYTAYNNPVSLPDFCEKYKELHRSDTPHGVFPDLFAAYAFNGAYEFFTDLGCAADNDPPDAVTISSSTHIEGQWSNSPDVQISIDDGADDMSGSYYYWQVWDSDSNTTLDDSATPIGTYSLCSHDIGDTSFCSKDTHNTYTFAINPLTNLTERGDHYLHVQTRDLARHLGTTRTYGPVMVDLTQPQFVSLTVPESPLPACTPGSPTYAIGSFLHFEWTATDTCSSTPDCVPSGVDYVQIVYHDDAGPSVISYPKVYGESNSYDLYLDPDLYSDTCAGRFYVTVYDRAGNASTPLPPVLAIKHPFDGPCTNCDVDLTGERTVSGDINCDGDDEVIMSRGLSLPLTRLDPLPCAAVACSSFGMGTGMHGGDLFLADTNRDGNLDLIAAGEWNVPPPGNPFQIRVWVNGTPPAAACGALTGSLTLTTGLAAMRVRVVDLFGTGEPVLIYTGQTGAGTPEIGIYNFASGASEGPAATVPSLPGVTPVLGDFEIGDVDADGNFDFVMAGTDGAGTSGVFYFVNGGGTWTRYTIICLPSCDFVDVDLGNWDNDRDLDLLVMYETSIGGTPTRVTRVFEFLSTLGTSCAPGMPAPPGTPFFHGFPQMAGFAEGDGHIVDIYNDGYSDALAMGRAATSGALQGWQLGHDAFGRHGSGLPPTIRSHLLYRTDTAWGDFDADGSLDVFFVGVRPMGMPASPAEWYRNLMSDYGTPNTAPSAPLNLSSVYQIGAGGAPNGYAFRWYAPPDTDQTPVAALGYELRVGTSAGGNDVISWAHLAGPSQQVAPRLYSDGHGGNYFERFVPLDLGNYYWSVRSVDSGWLRSLPAAEQTTVAFAVSCSSVPGDCDGDGTPDACEVDTDHDGVIDNCDDDDDNDGIPDLADPYPLDPHRCGDSDGDGCDDCAIGKDGFGFLPDFDPAHDGVDTDGDGRCDAGDPCPLDAADDSDGDGVCDSDDVCPGGNDALDTDGDGVPDACDPCPLDNPDDSDGDGVCNSVDVCPGGNDTLDSDGDGTPDACDPCPLDPANDADGDGICAPFDICLSGDDSVDSDGDGIPDACDPCPSDNPNDSDYDGVCDSADVCPGGDDYLDTDGDGTPDYCEDCNGNGIPDGQEIADGSVPDTNGNGVPDTCEPNELYVDPGASGSLHDGSSWCTAFLTLPAALGAAGSGDTIRIAKGTYLPPTTGLPDPRSAAFYLASNVVIEGGYAGCGAPDPNARDFVLYETILSGDLAADDAPGFVNYSDNAYHVISAGSGVTNAVLDGVTIRGGNADSTPPNHQGGGIRSSGASVMLNQCVVRENRANGAGGGIYVEGAAGTMTISNSALSQNQSGASGGAVRANVAANLTVQDCMLSNNTATSGGAISVNTTAVLMDGAHFQVNVASSFGGAAEFASSNPDIVRSTFAANSASGGGASGGALRFVGSFGRIVSCRFLGNSATLHGGAISSMNGAPSLVANCLFSGNTAGGNGGAMWTFDAGTAPFSVRDCTFSRNTAVSAGGGMHNSGTSGGGSHPDIANSIFWQNSDASGMGQQAQIRIAMFSSAMLNFSCVQGLTGTLGGTGNIGSDPMFLDSDGADEIVGTEDDNLRLRVVSPCIDAGGNSFVPADVLDLDSDTNVAEFLPLDLADRPRTVNHPGVPDTGMGPPPIVDMGAFERQLPGDLDHDGDIDLDDEALLTGCLSGPLVPAASGCDEAEADDDGAVTMKDVRAIFNAFTASP